MPKTCRAALKLGLLALLLSQAHQPMAAAQVVESDDHVIFRCPSSDFRTPIEIRLWIGQTVDHAIKYPGMFESSSEAIRRVGLPQLLIASDRTEDLGLLWNKSAIDSSADLNTAFHYALSTKNSSLMRMVALSNVRRTRTQAPFLAPTADLPTLAALYVKLFERTPDLVTEYRKLAESALAEARKVGPAPSAMEDERPEDRQRLATAWMLLHLERIRKQVAGPSYGHAQSRILLDRAAALVSRECQPRTWRLVEALRAGKSACSDRESGGQLLKSEHPYVCKLVGVMEAGSE